MASFSSMEFRNESWSLYGVGMAFVAFRFVARIKKLGLLRLQWDDYLMMNAAIWYTVLVTAANKIISGGGSNFMTAEEQAALTPAIIQDRVSGSKWVLVSEEAMIITIWSCKLCMLFIYHRLTEGLKQRKLIDLVLVYAILGFIGTQLALFLSCKPFKDYWSVPPADPQCSTYYNYGYAEAVFNITSDICVLLIAIPLLLQVRLPIQQRAVLVGIFGMGIFVIAAAILNKVYAYVPSLVSMYYLNWYIREASSAVYVANLPAIWSLLRDIFPSFARWGFKTKKSSGLSGSGSGWATANRKGGSHLSSRNYAMRPFGRLGSASGESGQNPASSQEYITNLFPSPQDIPSEKEVTITEKPLDVDDDEESGRNIYHAVP